MEERSWIMKKGDRFDIPGALLASLAFHALLLFVLATDSRRYPAFADLATFDLIWLSPSSSPMQAPASRVPQSTTPWELAASDHPAPSEFEPERVEPPLPPAADLKAEAPARQPLKQTDQEPSVDLISTSAAARQQTALAVPLPRSTEKSALPGKKSAGTKGAEAVAPVLKVEAKKPETPQPAEPEPTPPLPLIKDASALAKEQRPAEPSETEQNETGKEADRQREIAAAVEIRAEQERALQEKENRQRIARERSEQQRLAREQQRALSEALRKNAEKARLAARQMALRKAALPAAPPIPQGAASPPREAHPLAASQKRLAAEIAVPLRESRDASAADKPTAAAVKELAAPLPAVKAQPAQSAQSAAVKAQSAAVKGQSAAVKEQPAQPATVKAQPAEPSVARAPAAQLAREKGGMVFASLRGDLKMVIAGEQNIKLCVKFREYPKSRRNRVLTRSEARREQTIVPVLTRTGEDSEEAVIEAAREGIYVFSAESKDGKAAKGTFTLKVFESAKLEKIAALGARTVSGPTTLLKILMPEAILWDDDSAFTGSLEDSESVTRFNAATGLFWKEFNN